MNIQDISTQLLYTTVPVYVKERDGRESSGTGFIYTINESETSHIPLLITNYHVIENAEIGMIELHTGEKELPTDKTVQVNFDSSVKQHKLGNLDLVAIPIANVLNELQAKMIYPFFKSVSANMIPSKENIEGLAAIEDVTFIGYPNSIYDTVNKMPVIRQGITATPIWNKFQGNEVFLIDAGVFPGSSGSPVFIYNRGTYPTLDGIAVGNRLLFVGIISQTVLKKDIRSNDYLDLGVVINSTVFEHELTKHIEKLKSV